jgi:hypothetical protein
VDSKNGFALSDANLLFATSDGGETWTQLSVPSAVSDMCFSSPSIGFASTYLGIYVTTDGGAQWSLSNRPQLPADLGAFPIACSGSSAVVIGDPTGNGSPVDVFQTPSALDDQGQAEAGTWTEPVNAADPASSAPVPLGSSVENSFLFQTGPGVWGFAEYGNSPNPPPGIVPTAVVVHTTTDGGQSFVNSNVVQNSSVNAILAIASVPSDSQSLFMMLGYENAPFHTFVSHDGGATWSDVGQEDFNAQAGSGSSVAPTTSTTTSNPAPSTSTTTAESSQTTPSVAGRSR